MEDPMREMAMMALVGGGTLAMRSVFIVGSASLPASVERILRHAKPAILSALVGSFVAAGGVGWDEVLALAVAALVALRGGSMLLMIGAGVAVATLAGL
jgi:branched-subunit amino acid transport protein